MALLAVVPDVDDESSDTLIDVLNVSEAHWELRHQVAFVTLEFAVQLRNDSDSIRVCVHGKIRTSDERVKWCSSRYSYKRLFELAGGVPDPTDGIYDFRDSFRHKSETNRSYEGPPPFDEIKPVAGRGREAVSYYGNVAIAPACQFRVKVFDLCSVVTIVDLDDRFLADNIYLFRVGFFLDHPTHIPRSWLKRVWEPLETENTFHIYRCRDEAIGELGRAQIEKDLLKKSVLWLDIQGSLERYRKANPDLAEDLKVDPQTATTDLWWIVYRSDVCDRPGDPRAFDRNFPRHLRPKPVQYALFSDNLLDEEESPWHEYHVKLKRDVREFRGQSESRFDQGPSPTLLGTQSSLSVKEWFQAATSREKVPWLALGVALLSFATSRTDQAVGAAAILATLSAYVVLVAVKRHLGTRR